MIGKLRSEREKVKEYKVRFYIDFEVDADSEDEALGKAEHRLMEEVEHPHFGLSEVFESSVWRLGEAMLPHENFRCYMGWREKPLGTGEAPFIIVPLEEEELSDRQLGRLMKILKLTTFSEETIDFRVQELD